MARQALNISLPEELNAILSKYCDDHFTKPSDFIRRLLVDHLKDEGVLSCAPKSTEEEDSE
jgi:hypothetical protein